MPGRTRALLVAIAIAFALGLAGVWLATQDRPEPPRGGRAAGGSGTSGAAATVAPPPSRPPGQRAGAAGAAGPASGEGPPPPDEGADAESWRRSKVVFQPRELGPAEPYVKAALDDARRDVAFCFRRGEARAPGGGQDPEDDPGRRRRATSLVLYLVAREGALDVVDSAVESPGDANAAAVACCRDALRGRRIPAPGAAPGERLRMRFRAD